MECRAAVGGRRLDGPRPMGHHRDVAAPVADPLARGEEALAAGDVDTARAAFEEALGVADTPEARDGLGRALWWRGDVDDALDQRERAYAAFRAAGDVERAARLALWIAREYLEAVGNEPASNGWVARAERLLDGVEASSARGWLELTHGARAGDPREIRTHAEAALSVARGSADPGLEASALALLGRALILVGDVDGGMDALDEAMVVVTAGEVGDPLVFGDVCCVVTRGCEEAGEVARLMRWNEVIERYLSRHHHAPLLSFCGTCCAEMLEANGALSEAERWLTTALQALEGTGHTARCVHPAAKLAELRVLQGRLAKAVLLRRLNQTGDTILSVPVLSALVECDLDTADVSAAREAAARLRALADATGHRRVDATAALSEGRVALAEAESTAVERLESALASFSALEMHLAAARTRMEIARALRGTDRDVALREAMLAAEAFERLGASGPLDQAVALARELGGPARTGPKGVGLLSRREQEVLALLGEGLSNAEIASRLYISTKTAGHHVSSVLAKLHLRSRQEAAAFAVRFGAERPARTSAER